MMFSEFKYIGIGVDIENIERFKEYLNPFNKHLMNKIFTETELNYCLATKNPATHLAVRFAAKEATIKAFSSITKNIIEYNVIEISKNEIGVPIVTLNNESLNNYNILVSLSHSENNAIAFVIIGVEK